MKVKPYILCGGFGTRLWPLSRRQDPKQLIKMFEGKSLFRKALDFCDDNIFLEPSIIANAEHRFLIAEEIQQKNYTQCDIILEPEGRNTAAAAATACLDALQYDDDTLILLMASDHIIKKPDNLIQAIKAVKNRVIENNIAVFGIKPTSPHTGYGYIKADKQSDNIVNVVEFTEKPSLEKAEQYLKTGLYSWNASLFLFKATDMIKAFETHAHDIYSEVTKAYDARQKDLDFIRLDETYFKQVRSDSIDYAIMEKIDNVVCAKCDPDWSDLGDWQSMWKNFDKKDNLGNVIVGKGKTFNASDTLVYSEDILTCVAGVKNLAVITTADAVLVLDKDKSQDVKNIVTYLAENDPDKVTLHKKCYRPWGWFENLLKIDGFMVKRIMVKPGAKLSLQSHKHRYEHWVVVKGIADITVGEETRAVSANNAAYIPLGAKHRLANSSAEPIYIIEVQLGDILSEDDIVRYEDVYRRN